MARDQVFGAANDLDGSLGPFLTTAALENRYPAALNPGRRSLIGAAPPYVDYFSNGSAWTLAAAGGTGGDDKFPDIVSLEGKLSATGDNTALINSTMASMSAGQSLLLPTGSWRGDVKLTKAIRVLGVAMPILLGGVLVYGTVIKGTVEGTNIPGASFAKFGIDTTTLTPGDYPNGFTTGLTTTSSTTRLDQTVEEVAVLGRGFGAQGVYNSQHGFLVQNGRGVTFKNCRAYKFLNNFVSRASGVLFDTCHGEDAEANNIFFKSDTAGGANDAYDNTAINCTGVANSAGKYASFTAFAADTSGTYKTKNSKFMLCSAISKVATGAYASFRVECNTGGSNVGGEIGFCTSVNDDSGAAFVVTANECTGFTFSECRASGATGFSFRSNSTGAIYLFACSDDKNAINGTFTFAQFNGNVQSPLKVPALAATGAVTAGDYIASSKGGVKMGVSAADPDGYRAGVMLYKNIGAPNNAFTSVMETSDGPGVRFRMATGNAVPGTETYDVTGLQIDATPFDATKGTRASLGGAAIESRWTIPGGAAAAGYGQMKLKAGAKLTTPEDGVLEYDGTTLSFTIGSTRKTVNLT